MKVYVVVCEDRHIDIVVRVFSTPELAIDYAKKFVETNARHPVEEEPSILGDWLFYQSYSCEGDSVHVEETEIDCPGEE